MISAGIQAGKLGSPKDVSFKEISRLDTEELTASQGQKASAKVFVFDKSEAARIMNSGPARGAESYFKSPVAEKVIKGNTARANALAAAAASGNVEALADAIKSIA